MQFFEGDENFSWRVLAVESFVIMLSVFLGFLLNSWRISATQAKNVDTALRSITAEMQYNKQQLAENQPRYRAVADTLRQLVRIKDEKTHMELTDIPLAKGLSIPILRTSAFETARSSGILANIKFELANRLFAYYNKIKFYNNLLNQISKGFFMGEYKTIEDWLVVYNILASNGNLLRQPRSRKVLNNLLERYNTAKPDTALTDTTATGIDTTQTDTIKTDTTKTN